MTEPRAVRWGRAAYRRLLTPLQPPFLRARYGDDMDAAFREQLDDAVRRRGWLGAVGVLARTARGALRARFDVNGAARPEGGPRTGGGGVDVKNEVRQAARRLRRSPGFTAVAVATLALGVGAFASVFGVVAGILVAPLPYDDPDELVWIWRDYWGDFPRGWLSGVDVARLRDDTGVFEGIAAFRTARVTLTDDDGSSPREVEAVVGSPGFVELLGIAPALGPGFTPVEYAPDAPDEVVVSHDLWQRAFGGDPALAGRDVRINGSAYRVVGVLPPGLDFRVHSSLGDPRGGDLWFVLSADLAASNVFSGQYAGLARIRDGVSAAEVDAALARVSRALDAESFRDRGLRLWSVGLHDDLVADARAPLGAVLGAAAFLLLILGANLATLFLTRAEDRLGETSVRSALGAGRPALIVTTLGEPLLVAAGGLAGGILLAAWATPALAHLGRDVLPRTAELGLDPRVLGGALVATVAVAAFAAAGPLLRTLRVGPDRGLRAARAGPGRAGARTRSALVVTQIALSLALVVGAGLLTRSLQALLVQDPGFDPGSAVAFRVSFRGAEYEDGRLPAAQEAVRVALANTPGVAAAGHVGALPLSMETNQTTVTFPGAPGNTGDPDEDGLQADVFNISAGYVEAAGLRLREGTLPRVVVDSASAPDPAEVLVDEALARRFFPSGGAVGAPVFVAGDTARVVGVVDQARLYAVERDDRGQIYVPAPQWDWSSVSYVVRPREGVDPLELIPVLRAAVAAFDPGLPVDDARLLADDVIGALAPDRLNLGLVAGFALTALVLAALGVYGVVANAVVRRRREIGLRMAMGADAGQVVRLVVGRGLRLILVGAATGLLLAALAARWSASLLYGVTPFDLPTYGTAATALGGLAALAAWLPARRATRVAPREALQGE